MDDFLDVVIEDARWIDADLQSVAHQAAAATFAELGLPLDGFSLCVLGCDDARIAALNADFRGKPAPTNVLSWPSEERGAMAAGTRPALPQPGLPDDPAHLGDIAIAYDTCKAEAEAAGKPFSNHIAHLVAHGVLHLFGYDHIRDADGDMMEATEVRILARLGLPDPYLDPQSAEPQ